VDTSIHHPGSAFPRHAADLHASQSIAGVDANAYDVAGLYEFGMNLFKSLVSDNRIAVFDRTCRRKYV
jgi:hypothetical protein